jgi:hypothetical protein
MTRATAVLTWAETHGGQFRPAHGPLEESSGMVAVRAAYAAPRGRHRSGVGAAGAVLLRGKPGHGLGPVVVLPLWSTNLARPSTSTARASG